MPGGEESIVVRFLFGEDLHPQPGRNQKPHPSPPPPSGQPAKASQNSNGMATNPSSNNNTTHHTNISIPSDHWSIKFPREGEVPKLKWVFQSETTKNISSEESKVFITPLLVCMYVCMYVCMHVYVRMYVCVCMYVYVCIMR